MILAASEEMLPVWNADPRRETTRLAQNAASGSCFSLPG